MMDANFKALSGGAGGGIFDLLASPQVMGPSMGTMMQPKASDAAAFGNLLDLVADMQIADEQSPVQADFLSQQTAQLNDPALTALAACASQATWADPLAKAQLLTAQAPVQQATESKSGVGRQTPAVGEIPSTSELLLNSEATANAGLLAKSQSVPALDAASARIWAAALATGDMKTVAIEAQEEPRVEQPLPIGALLGLEKAKPQAPAPMPVPGAAKAVVAPKMESIENPVEAPRTTLAGQQQQPRPQSSEPHRVEEAVFRQKVVEAQPKPSTIPAAAMSVAKSQEGAEPAGFEPAGFKPFVAGTRIKSTEEKPAKKAMSGSDFLLERSTAGTPAKLEAQSLIATDKLGQQGDSRISSQSLDFVADKIDSLRQQGGGKLRVELNPGHLGSVEIRVSNVRGLMKVEVLAEKPETVKALADSKVELAGKLEAIAPSKLDVGALHVAKNHVNVASATSSESLNMRGTPMHAQSQVPSQSQLQPQAHAQVENLRNLSNVANHGSDMGGFNSNQDRSGFGSSFEHSSDWMSQRDQSQQHGQQREERRDRARREWEDFSQERKSA